MNRITAFSNAAEFQALFGKTEHGTRRNAILLSFLKSRTIWDWCRKHNDWTLLGTSSMASMYRRIFVRLDLYSQGNYIVALKGWGDRKIQSDKYETDEYQGIPTDDTASSGDFIRYINKETDKVYKMRSGKFLRKVILESEFGRALPEQVLTWMLESFVSDWRVQCESVVPKYHLVVDDDFEAIYRGRNCCGSFDSCMTNAGYHTFYEDAVDAKAASLRDDNGTIIARCVIYTDVYDEDDNKWRLAERQYATKELHKQLLVDALIKAGEIDGYKRIGADCGAATSFVSNDGEDISHKDFSIRCNLNWGDTVSYQDSFKWFCMDEQKAYNTSGHGSDEYLDTTGGELPGEWDSYHERDCRETVRVYYEGTEYWCDEDDLGEFAYFHGEYYHVDDIMECPVCGDEFLNPDYYNEDSVYSDVTEEYYCCESCKEQAEDEYKQEHWFYSDIDDEYFEFEDEITEVLMWHDLLNKYIVGTVCVARINEYIKNGVLFSYNGVLVDTIKPMLICDQICQSIIELYKESA